MTTINDIRLNVYMVEIVVNNSLSFLPFADRMEGDYTTILQGLPNEILR
jgi:hypothetical protein